jgi:hypothetical protein
VSSPLPARSGAGRARSVSLVDAFAVGGLAILLYLPALWTGFSADDFFILSRLQDTGGLRHPLTYFQTSFFGYYRPLGFVSAALDWQLWGGHPAGFHLTSIFLHALNTILVYVLGRRLCDRTCALIGAVLFATHPAAHEAVYWMAARFDLLATLFTLCALTLLSRERPLERVLGLTAFALALLSKESAIALVVLTVAEDVIVHRRDWLAAVRRLLPVAGVAAGYVLVRVQVPDLAAAGGRLPKLVVLAAALASLLLAPWLAAREPHPQRRRFGPAALWITVGGVALLTGLLWPETGAWMRQKLGFVAYAVYYLVSPVVLPSPPPRFFTPGTAADGLPGLVAALVIVIALWRSRRWFAAHATAANWVVFTAAALIPVLSLTGSPRYVYLATAGAALLVGSVFQALTGRARLWTAALLSVFLVVSVAQVLASASAWRWSSEMVRDGLRLMSAELEPCGTHNVVLLTAPKGIRGVYPNIYWDAFKATSGCTPASIGTLLIVTRFDVRVEVSQTAAGDLELRVPRYAGNLVASKDLRAFDYPVPVGTRTTLETAAGQLEMSPDGNAQLFRLHPNAAVRSARLFYYSEGRMRSVARSDGG